MKIRELTQRLRLFINEGLWADAPASRWVVARGVGLLQFAVMTGQGFVRDQLLLRATALSYFTVLSLIPMVAIVIGIADAMGISENIAGILVSSIASGAPEAQQAIIDRIEGAQLGALGTLGAVVLAVMTILGISNIERALNSIWGVKRQRSLGRRFPDYLSILVVVPLLLGAGLSLSTTLKSQWLVQQLLEYQAFSILYDIGLRQAPTIVLSLGFAVMFWFLPNTSVRFSSAALGGIVSGMLVLVAQDVYLGYSVGVARSDALFGTFAQLPLLFVWIYIFWAIVLFGAEVAFAHQNLALYRREVRGASALPAERDAIALRISIEVARSFRNASDAPSADDLADGLRVPVRTVRDVLGHLEAAGIVSLRRSPTHEESFQLGQPAERIQIIDVLTAVRGCREAVGADRAGAAVERLLAGLDCAAAEGAAGQTLAELLAAIPAARGDAIEPRLDAGSLDRSAARG